MKNLFWLLLVFFTWTNIFSQNDPFISHMGLHRYLLNPAATGTDLSHQFGFIYRGQWIGFTDAPSTAILNAHSYLPYFQIGIGTIVIQDKLGIENTLTFKTTYAYHIIFDEVTILSMGLSAGIIRKSFEIHDLILEQPEYDIEQALETKLKPDFGCGFEMQINYFKTGFSISHIPNSNIRANNFRMPRHVYAYLQYIIPLSDKFLIVPNILYMNVSNIHSLSLSIRAEFEKTLWFGTNYQFFNNLTFMAGAFIQKNIRIGYAYDWNHSVIRKYNSGSHEIFLHYTIDRKNIKSKSPRFFN